jgi:hypothetical protein
LAAWEDGMSYDLSGFRMLCGTKMFVAMGGKPVPNHLQGVEGAYWEDGEWHAPVVRSGDSSVLRRPTTKRARRRMRVAPT